MSNIEKKTLLKNVHFDFEKDDKSKLGPHVHYTLGAASKMDEPLLLKSQNKELSDEEKEILKKVTTKKEEDMGEDVTKEYTDKIADLEKKLEKFEEIEKELKKTNVEKSLSDFDFEEDLSKELINALVDLDEGVVDTITKGFSAMKDFKEEIEENPIQKELSKEVGAEGDAEVVEKSLSEQIKESREKLNK